MDKSFCHIPVTFQKEKQEKSAWNIVSLVGFDEVYGCLNERLAPIALPLLGFNDQLFVSSLKILQRKLSFPSFENLILTLYSSLVVT